MINIFKIMKQFNFLSIVAGRFHSPKSNRFQPVAT